MDFINIDFRHYDKRTLLTLINSRMIRRIILISIYLLIIENVFGQDQITRKDGSVVDCKITSIDTSKIEIIIFNSEKSIKTYVAIPNITSFTYNGLVYDMDKIEKGGLNSILKKKDIKGFKFADSIENINICFIYTYTDEIINGKNISFNKPFLEPSFFLVDSKKYPSDMVKFYKNGSGFYANIKDIKTSGSSKFSKRISNGKINLFEYITSIYYPGDNYSSGMVISNINNYYNRGFGELNKANYHNLNIELSDNPESLEYLNKYKFVSNAQTILYITGGVTFIAGFIALFNETTYIEPNDQIVIASMVTIGIGSGCIGIGYAISDKKRKHLRNAIETYNK